MKIVWRAFELRPEPVPTLPPDGEYLRTVWANSVYPLAERLGITMKLPPVQPRSRLAHEAAKWAQANDRFEDFNKALFRAIFERGENIGEIDVLVSLADGLDLDGEDLRNALKNHAYLEAVLRDERDAEMLGVTGVPAFVADRRYAATGVQTIESLKSLIEKARG